uniref:Uncharacterized protein n=2 Tax=Anguilla anguilla TaxID=7936 RepID=A0A0E9PAC0_ANGAN
MCINMQIQRAGMMHLGFQVMLWHGAKRGAKLERSANSRQGKGQKPSRRK